MKISEIKGKVIFKQDSSDWCSLLISFFMWAYLTAFSFCTNYFQSEHQSLKKENHMKINEIKSNLKNTNYNKLKKIFFARFCSVSTCADSNRTGE